MELDVLVSHFEGVRMNGRGFTSRCPAHIDKDPSLTVARGSTGWLVKCQAGCNFFDVVSAAGLRPLDFKFGSSSLAAPDKPDQTRRIMGDMVRESRRIVWQFGELMMLAFDLDSERVTEVLDRYPEFDNIGLREAMNMHAIMFAGPVADLIGHRYYPQYDQNARGRIGARLWQEYTTQQSSLA